MNHLYDPIRLEQLVLDEHRRRVDRTLSSRSSRRSGRHGTARTRRRPPHGSALHRLVTAGSAAAVAVTAATALAGDAGAAEPPATCVVRNTDVSGCRLVPDRPDERFVLGVVSEPDPGRPPVDVR